MFIIPYKMETIFTRLPITNVVIIAIISTVSFLTFFDVLSADVVEPLVLRDWDIGQLIGNTLLHGRFFHLLGNMLFLRRKTCDLIELHDLPADARLPASGEASDFNLSLVKKILNNSQAPEGS